MEPKHQSVNLPVLVLQKLDPESKAHTVQQPLFLLSNRYMAGIVGKSACISLPLMGTCRLVGCTMVPVTGPRWETAGDLGMILCMQYLLFICRSTGVSKL